MKTKSIVSASLILFGMLLSVFPAERADAVVRYTISMYCSTNATYISPAPSPSVGCKVNWWPGGLGHRGDFRGEFFNCTPNCTVVPAMWFNGLAFNPQIPTIGNTPHMVGWNCYQTVTVSVTAIAITTSRNRNNPTPQFIVRNATGTVAYYCPTGTVGMGGI